ncbi:MAG: hypothetical protein F6K09_12400 [Merismopedia sp. SIO2A8]|nr:hypothetical protein [Merismopedia sp. SIO2A8]
MSSLGFMTTALTTLSVGAVFWTGMGEAIAQEISSSPDTNSDISGETVSMTLTDFMSNGGRQMTFRPFSTPTLSPPSEQTSTHLVAGTVTSAHGEDFAEAHNADVDLRIQPRINVGHTSSGAWLNGLSRIDAWVPVRQQIGEDITFVEPRLSIDNKGNFGGNFLLGHREYDRETERLWAGYAAWDIRETEHDTFHQLGLGLETLGDTWDVHLNGYIPLGDRTETFDESFFGTDGVVSSSGFEGNLLVLSERQEQSRFFREEVALGGFDLGTTVELVEWDDGDGDLRALAGIYHLGGPSVDDDLGWRLGLIQGA